MKLIFTLIICGLACAVQAQFGFNNVAVVGSFSATTTGGGGGGGGVCPGSPLLSNDGATSITFGGGNIMIGQADWTDGGTPRTICRLDFEITGATGASGKTFYAKIYQMKTTANTYDLDIVTGPVATSTGVTGVDAWSATWVQFDFPTPYTTTASVRYALVVTLDVAFGSNDMQTFTDNTALTGYRDVFTAAGAAGFAGGNDVSIKIYWQ